MNLLSTILEAQGGGLVNEVAKNLNLNPQQAQGAIQHMLPALTRGIQRNVQQGGLEGLVGALQSGNHQRYLNDPSLLGQAASVTDGNKILGHILGSKDVSRNVAGHAAQQTGLDPSILRKMLPMLATVAMGALSKGTNGGGLLGAAMGGLGGGGAQRGGGGGLLGGLLKGVLGGGRQRQQGGGGGDLLGSLLDADGDGSAVDDILGMAKKFF